MTEPVLTAEQIAELCERQIGTEAEGFARRVLATLRTLEDRAAKAEQERDDARTALRLMQEAR